MFGDDSTASSSEGDGVPEKKPVECCWSIIEEYRAAGKIKYVGFSTHGPTDLINKFIETNKFDYVNLHYYFCVLLFTQAETCI